MTQAPTPADPLGHARDALFDTLRHADALSRSVERLEAQYAGVRNLSPGFFYVPTHPDGGYGRTLFAGWTDHAPKREREVRLQAIHATLRLRAAIDSAVEAVSNLADCMNGASESADQRWTVRTIHQLRTLRGAILKGHYLDAIPSALPMVQVGVPAALREHGRNIAARMEEVKSAILAGVKSQGQRMSSPQGESGQPTSVDTVNVPPPSRPDASDLAKYRNASWIRKATNGGLNGDSLSKMRKRGKLRAAASPSVPLYDVTEVAKLWPQYSAQLLDALREGADFRKPRKTERRGPTKPDKTRQSPTRPDK